MSEEGYKPSKEENKKAIDSLSIDQQEESSDREYSLVGSERHLREAKNDFTSKIQLALDDFTKKVSSIDRGLKSTEIPSRLKEDIETAKRIQSEISQGLEELKKIFKGDPTNFGTRLQNPYIDRE